MFVYFSFLSARAIHKVCTHTKHFSWLKDTMYQYPDSGASVVEDSSLQAVAHGSPALHPDFFYGGRGFLHSGLHGSSRHPQACGFPGGPGFPPEVSVVFLSHFVFLRAHCSRLVILTFFFFLLANGSFSPQVYLFPNCSGELTSALGLEKIVKHVNPSFCEPSRTDACSYHLSAGVLLLPVMKIHVNCPTCLNLISWLYYCLECKQFSIYF